MKMNADRIAGDICIPPVLAVPSECRWVAVFTAPRSEKSVQRHLEQRQIESFLPLYHVIHSWKNRQRVRVSLPLFPGYIFVRLDRQHRSAVLQVPRVIYIVGTEAQAEIPDAEINALRDALTHADLTPFMELVVGERVRIKAGPMAGIEGVLVRKPDSLMFILTVNMINQSAALAVNAEDLEPVA